METVIRWWGHLAARDRRALVVLGVVGPLVLLVWGVTLPLLEDRDAGQRAVAGLTQQLREMGGLVERYRQVSADTVETGGKPSEKILGVLEADLQGWPAAVPRPTLHRAFLTSGGFQFPAGELRFSEVGLEGWTNLLLAVASGPYRVAGLSMARVPGKPLTNGKLLLWLPE